MKGQVSIESYDEATGESRYKIATKWGTFDRTVKCSEEDKDIENRFDGIRFARYLCYIDELRAKARAFDQRAIGMKHAADVLYSIATDEKTIWEVGGDSVLEVRILAEVARNQARELRLTADTLEKRYPEMVKSVLSTRRDMRQRVANKKKEENE